MVARLLRCARAPCIKQNVKSGKKMEKSELYVHGTHNITHDGFSIFFFFFCNFELCILSPFVLFLHYGLCDLRSVSEICLAIANRTSYSLRACTLCKICKSAIHIIQYFCIHSLVCLFVNFCAIIRFVTE